jgi:hypothetical protein
MAAAFQRARERAFRAQPQERIRVVQRSQQVAAPRIVLAAFDADHSLADGRHAHVEIEHLGDSFAEPKSLEAGAGEQDRVEAAFLEPAQAGVHVAAQQLEDEVRAHASELRLPARARGADPRPVVKIGEVRESQ